ncbi:hypothetical protein BCV72DRAFT_301308 [Rhizopus microsporus var. microsporus]|uniref:Tc1-like transposase DDE domain-containing protein n=1 Tax=Rhizopus microsporus var. microsporus TaxID=86635 RepID=A0A1X0RGC8_RHIZD|nr:hypothetical protein BCV72DRAFT_301308 [Rhizopus microsporus var. microsporus]
MQAARVINWARSPTGARAVVKTARTRVTSHTVIGTIHLSAVFHVVSRNLPPEPELDTVAKKKKKSNSRKKRDVAETNNGEGTQEDDTSAVNFFNEILDIINEDESVKGSYLVMGNARIHNSIPMIRKIEARGYRFWALVKGKMKHHRLMKEETSSSRIGDAYNDVRFSDPYSLSLHSKRQIINCYK